MHLEPGFSPIVRIEHADNRQEHTIIYTTTLKQYKLSADLKALINTKQVNAIIKNQKLFKGEERNIKFMV